MPNVSQYKPCLKAKKGNTTCSFLNYTLSHQAAVSLVALIVPLYVVAKESLTAGIASGRQGNG